MSESESITIAFGMWAKSKGSVGSWLVLIERGNRLNVVDVKAVQVDGEKVLADTYYVLLESSPRLKAGLSALLRQLTWAYRP